MKYYLLILFALFAFDPAAICHAEVVSSTAHLTLYSTTEQGKQPYTLYVPSTYSATQATPLIIALHGGGDDEKKFFTGYNHGVIKDFAEEYGMLIVCPRGAKRSGWQGPGEENILTAIDQVRGSYNIDAARIFLLGHSMGGGGALAMAAKAPRQFAAVVAFAPSRTNPAWVAALRSVPLYLVQGGKDTIVPSHGTDSFVAFVRQLGGTVIYRKIPRGDHNNIVVPEFARAFAWLNDQ